MTNRTHRLSLPLAAGLLLVATVSANAFGGGVGAGGGGGFGIPIWQPAPPYLGVARVPHHVSHHAARRAYDRISDHHRDQR